jgi:hypothetical protein
MAFFRRRALLRVAVLNWNKENERVKLFASLLNAEVFGAFLNYVL